VAVADERALISGSGGSHLHTKSWKGRTGDQPDHNRAKEYDMNRTNGWKVITAGAALTGIGLLGAGVASADGDDMLAQNTQTVLAMDDSYWDDTSWD
jgi:hypothetical protein